MRGASRAYKKIGDAKYRVKTTRANADREVRGADPDYSTRGSRAAAMDPSTAFVPHEGQGCGQERRVRGGGDGYGRDATATGGAAASSSSEWRTSAVDVGSSHQGDAGSTEPVPAAAGEAGPCAAPGGHVSSDGSGAPPPVSTVASSGTMMATGRERLQGAVWTRPLRPGHGTAAMARGSRWMSQGLLGGTSDKWMGPLGPYPATDHRDPSCPPIAKGTRRRPVVRGPTAPWAASVTRGRIRGMRMPRRTAPRVLMTNGSLFHRLAPRVPTGVRRLRRSILSAMWMAEWALSPVATTSAAAMAHFGSRWRRRRARPPRDLT